MGEVLGRAASPLTAADWPLGQSRAASCSRIHHLPTCTALLRAQRGRHYFSHFTPKDFSCQIKKKMTQKIITQGHERNNNNNNTTERSFLPMKIGLASTQSISHQQVYCRTSAFSQQEWLKPELNWPWASGRTHVHFKTQLPLFITSTSLSAQRTGLLMNNDVKTGGVKTQLHHPRGTLEKRTVTNRDWMKVIHFNHTKARPPSHCPRGLLYLSTFSFLLLFLGLGWW